MFCIEVILSVCVRRLSMMSLNCLCFITALVWQLMRAYTLAVLRDLTKSDKPIVDQDIVNWANKKLASANKTSKLDSFKDHSIADGRVVIDLIDSIVPGSIRYDLVRQPENDEVRVVEFYIGELPPHCT